MKKTLVLLLFVLSNISFSQTKEGMEICLAMQSNNFMSDTEAENALDKILNTIGASRNFILIPCSKINNAVATSYKGIRYILYDKEFMQRIKTRTDDWSSLAILAHEVGHHINGHSLDILLYAGGVVEPKSLERKRQQELEADEFAGFVMARLGASLNNALSFTNIFSDSDDTYSTHPSKAKRANAVRKGFKKAGNNLSVINPPNTPVDFTHNDSKMSFEEYIINADKNYKLGDYESALINLNNAIRINTEIGWVHNYRGNINRKLNQTDNAIKDYLQAIYLEPSNPVPLYNLGNLAFSLKYYIDALNSYNKAIEINPLDYTYFLNRGDTYFKLKKYRSAISDYNSSLKMNPNESYIYLNMALSKLQLKDYEGAIQNYTTAINNHSLGGINWNLSDGYFNRAFAYSRLKYYKKAIYDYSEVIKLEPYNDFAYFNRGIEKYNLGEFEGACIDFEKSISLGYDDESNINWAKNVCN